MFIFLIVIHIFSCLFLVATILLQSGRGGGLSESFGAGGSTSTIFGTSASTFLQRATSVCAIVFLLTSLSLAILSSRRSRSLMELNRIKRVLPQATRQVMPQDTARTWPVGGVEDIKVSIPVEEIKEVLPGEETEIPVE